MKVTIEGTLTPSTYLARGQQTVVELTDEVQRKIARGYVKIVKRHAPTDHEGTEVGNPNQEPLPTGDFAPAVDPPTTDALGAPSRGASRADWATFLLGEGIITQDQHDDTEIGRNDLLAVWDGSVAGSTTPVD